MSNKKIEIGKEVALEYNVHFSENDFDKMVEHIKVLAEMVKTQNAVLQNMLSETPPIFAAIIQKFIITNLIFNQNVEKLLQWANEISADIWATKLSRKGGEA